MAFFSRTGFLTIGKQHKGKHVSKVPADYLAWACANINGFRAEMEKAKKTKILEIRPRQIGKKVRYYKLDYNKMYQP